MSHARRHWVLFAISAGSVASLLPLLWLMQSHVSDPDPSDLNHWWLVFGFSAQALFAGRLIVQWVATEKLRRSVVPMSFWWLSLLGGLMLLVYFWRRSDPVGIAGQLFGNVVYMRNLYFLYSERRLARAATTEPMTAEAGPPPPIDETQETPLPIASAGPTGPSDAALPASRSRHPPPRRRPSGGSRPASGRAHSGRQSQSRQRQ